MVLSVGISNTDIVVGALACILLFLGTRSTRIPRGASLPPGPPRKAIVGNFSDIPEKHEWETYTHWAKKYGELVYIKVFRQPIVYINSVAAAQDLFEKRSSIYSDRFDFPMLIDLMGFDWNFVAMRYGDRWRRHRKMFHQKFHPTPVGAYHSIQYKHTLDLLRRLHKSPKEFLIHLRHLTGAIIMEIIYGIKVLPADDPYIKLAEEALAAVGSIPTNPGAYLVDTVPILKHVPEWMPGAGFKTKARIWRQAITQMPTVPFDACKKALREGKGVPSFTASFLESTTHLHGLDAQQEEHTIRNTGATAFGAGADTTTVALSWFVLAMILYPDVQRKAQAELDDVIGADRLPGFEDRQNLPYINALCKEIQRWHPVFPLAIAHGVMEDDIYNNYFIPKGSVIIGNSWAMLHDETMYGPRPEHFEPERFFRPGVKDPSAAFGFGRRICPGRYLADNTIYIATSTILKLFNISPAKEANGTEIPIDVTFTSGTISCVQVLATKTQPSSTVLIACAFRRPDPFECSITPRIRSSESLLEHYQGLWGDEL
ncbi:cytochrome P450 [Gautieria morchelliformis]|nr:cytochrome P450 [Gautieria morchelliformis]